MPNVNSIGFPGLLSIMLFLPAVGGLLLMFVPEPKPTADAEGDPAEESGWSFIKIAAIVIALATFALSVLFLVKYSISDASVPGGCVTTGPGGTCAQPFGAWNIQFAQHFSWLPSLGINYFVGVDGLNIWLLVLTTSVMSLAIFASCFMIDHRVKAFLALMLIAETGILGVFLSLNVFLFYIFWEAMLIPAYFLVGMWGEKRRVYATTKFMIYTIFGGLIMLVAIFYLSANTPGHSLDVPNLMAHQQTGSVQTWLFLAFMLAFAIKAGLFPFHSWAPDTYVAAPVPVAILIAAVMGKTATYAMLRFALPIFPHAANQLSPLISILAIIGILYAAGIALVQVDVKRTLAFASISHMNIIVLGVFALNVEGMDGSILQMINHGVIMAGLFFVVAMVTARSGTRRLDEMSGLAKAFPVLAAFGLLLFLAAMDLPGLGSFAGEFTILIGVYLTNAWFASIAAVVTIFAAWYTCRWFQGIFHGLRGEPAYPSDSTDDETAGPASVYEYPVRRPHISVDLMRREWILLLPLAAVIAWLGIFPKPVTDRTGPTTTQLSAELQGQSNSLHSSIAGPAKVGPPRDVSDKDTSRG